MHGVCFDLLHVGLLASAVAATNAFIVACLKHVALPEGTEEWLLFHLSLNLWESNVCSERGFVWIEAAFLTNTVGPGLVTVDYLLVLLDILVTAHVLLAFIRFKHVTNPAELRQWFCLNTSSETWSSLRNRTCRRTDGHVWELGLTYKLVSARRKWFGFDGTSRRRAHYILARILIRVTKRVASEPTKCLLRASRLIHRHASVLTNFVTLPTIRLVVRACVADCQADRH